MFTPLDHEIFFVVAVFSFSSLIIYALIRFGKPYALFFYNCFLKPFSGKETSGRDQQTALESFYKGQAAIYDATRSHLLRGREDMLALAAAQLRLKNEREGFRKRVWVDVSIALI
jgi:betaine lipid synthase